MPSEVFRNVDETPEYSMFYESTYMEQAKVISKIVAEIAQKIQPDTVPLA